MTNLPEWDLSNFYKSPEDPKLAADMKLAHDQATAFASKYKSKINNNTQPRVLLQALKDFEAVGEAPIKPEVYAFLAKSTDSQKFGGFFQKIQSQAVDLGKLLMFFELDLGKLDPNKLLKIAAKPEFANYQHYINRLVEVRKYQLPERIEKILADKFLTGRAVMIRIFDQTRSTKKYSVEVDGKVKSVSESQILDMLHDKKRSTRKKVAQAFTSGLNENIDLVTTLLNGLMQDADINNRYRGFKQPDEPRHLDNEIDAATVNLMSQVVLENAKLAQDYYKFKATALKIDNLAFYDRQAPIITDDFRLNFKSAAKTVLSSFKNYDAKYFKLAEKLIEDGRVDAPAKLGKQGGAFCLSAGPSLPSYVLVNFTGKRTDLSTLAHELGHAINGELMRKQTLLNYGNPTILAEVASLFSEMILFDDIIKNVDDNRERLLYITDKIEDLIGNIFRGISVYQFELELHKRRKEKGELGLDEIKSIWLETQGKIYGKAVAMDGGFDVWWSYIGHLFHYNPPFYYYSYSFGALTALSFYAYYKKSPKKFVKNYYEFLSDGHTQSPKDRLAKMGVDISQKEYWQQGLDILKDMTKQAKAALRKI